MPGNELVKCPGADRPVTDLAQSDVAASPCKAVKALAGVIVHELNNILTAAIGNLSLLNDVGFADTEAAAQIVGEVLAASRRGVSLSEELEAFASQLRLEPETVDANRLVQQALARSPDRLRGPAVQLRLAPVQLPLHIDPVRFRMAVASAASGAIRIMSKQADCLSVETAAVADADGNRFVQISIVCDGEAVHEDAVADALVNFHSGARTGMWGLASVAGFLTQSGGRLRARVEPASRLRLTIELPA